MISFQDSGVPENGIMGEDLFLSNEAAVNQIELLKVNGTRKRNVSLLKMKIMAKSRSKPEITISSIR